MRAGSLGWRSDSWGNLPGRYLLCVGVCMHLGPPIRPPAEPKPGEVIYRLYFFNDSDHISTSHEFFASTDEEAIEASESQRKGRKAELWQRARVVKVWR